MSPADLRYIQGSVTVLSLLAEWMENRGWNTPFCTQRTNSSSSGAGPAKPPMSAPSLGWPDRPMPVIMGMLYCKEVQLVQLSPHQFWAYC